VLLFAVPVLVRLERQRPGSEKIKFFLILYRFFAPTFCRLLDGVNLNLIPGQHGMMFKRTAQERKEIEIHELRQRIK
jgi:hypothetical protein